MTRSFSRPGPVQQAGDGDAAAQGRPLAASLKLGQLLRSRRVFRFAGEALCSPAVRLVACWQVYRLVGNLYCELCCQPRIGRLYCWLDCPFWVCPDPFPMLAMPLQVLLEEEHAAASSNALFRCRGAPSRFKSVKGNQTQSCHGMTNTCEPKGTRRLESKGFIRQSVKSFLDQMPLISADSATSLLVLRERPTWRGSCGNSIDVITVEHPSTAQQLTCESSSAPCHSKEVYHFKIRT